MKAPDAFRTISEVAEDLDLPQHVLRFWETRFNQIKPMKRGGGRRYYRPEDVDLLRGIRVLLYAEGFTIRGVQRVLKEKGIAYVAGAGQTGSVQAVATGDAGHEPEPAPAWEEADPDGADSSEGSDVRAPEGSAGPNLDLRTDPGFGPPAASSVELQEEMRSGPPHFAGTADSGAAQPPVMGLSQSDRRRIEFALGDLLEAKRLLDQVR